ncbi:MAG: ABC transporter ATP-binding protein [Thermosphaera aggregans]|jgi:ABC-type multidrug transport system ATPase subunit|uniref:ABC transporter ATP-binding protein n=1 Tax=Thermosphaera aggregans TaxID=54254 RepID=UPI003C0E6A83
MVEIRCEDLWKIYGSGIIALRGVSFALVDEPLVILAGPNGSGKTTLVRIIDGEISPSRGFVSINGLSLDDARARGLFGVMPQEAMLHEYLSVREYLYYLALIRGLNRYEAKREVSRVIDDFMLQDYASTRIEHLSGGLKRRVLLAQAFLGSPEILLLDEPTVGLDPEMRVKLWDVVMRYARERGSMIILVTHYIDEVRDIASRVLLLYRGQLVFNGEPRELLSKVGYKYRVQVRLREPRAPETPPLRLHHRSGDVVEFYVVDDGELVRLLNYLAGIGDWVLEFNVDRPSLEESYLELIKSLESGGGGQRL